MEGILVAVDGSKYSDHVVDVASDLAKKMSSQIVLVYVMKTHLDEPEGVMEFERVENFKDAYATYLKDVGESVISKISNRLNDEKVPYRSLIETGNPAEKILEVARLEKPKLIVLGLRGLHGVTRLRALGSIARRVIENSDCPVLVVPKSD